MAELRSISRAADTLPLAPAQVALLVRELEHEIKATLFEHGMHDATPTPAGECLYGMVSPLLEEFGTLFEHLEDAELDSEQFRLHVASSGGVTLRVASRIMQQLLGEHPELDLRVRSGSHDQGLRRLLDNEVGLAFGAANPVPDGVVFRPLLFSRWVMITPPAHPLAERETMTLDEFGQWPTIAPTPKYLSLEPEGDEAPYRHPRFQRGVVVETDGWPAAYAFVEAGVGVTIADALSIPKDARVATVPLADCPSARNFGLFHRSQGPDPRFLQLFAEAAQAEYPDASSRRGAAMP